MIKGNAASTTKSKYLLGKFDDKVLSYGIQANVADFAYAKSQDDYLKKSFGQHFGTFVFGGLGGALQGHAIGNKKVALNENRLIKLGLRFGSNMVAQSIEYAFQSHAKSNYSGFYTKDFQKKLLLSSYKSFFTSLMMP